MRIGPCVLVAVVLASAAMCSPALAADSLSVYVDNNSIALGAGTQLAAHAETDDAYGGGHVAFKFKGADQDCRPTPAEDDGADATGEKPSLVPAGAGARDVAGEPIQLDVGLWVVCGWLIDDASGNVVATGATVVEVVPYRGSLSISVKRVAGAFQVVLAYSTSEVARLYSSIQRAGKQCPVRAAKMPKHSLLLVPRGGRYIGSDGGLGRSIGAKQLAPGRWRVCAWLEADDGAVGPVSKTFAMPRKSRRGARAAG
jgi:hypothetical protein